MKKAILVVLSAFCGLSLWASVDLVPPASTGEVKPGEWNVDFVAATNVAFRSHIPLVVFWGTEECKYCDALISTINASADIKTYLAEKKPVLVFDHGAGKYGNANGPTRKWLNAIGCPGAYPRIAVYWQKSNGEVVTTLFSGQSGKMPVKTGDLATQFRQSLDLVLADYGKSETSFAVAGTPGDRLEAEVGHTTFVDVPLVREATGVATNWIQVGGVKSEIAWDADEAQKTFRYALPADAAKGEIAMTLYDADGETEVATSAIVCTNRPNAISYPYWIGERTAETLGWGEWTMDLAVAKAKVAAESGSAYTLVNVGGDLWCPYCQGIARSLYADASFAAWAKARKVALVSLDQPRAGTRQASLLTYEASASGASGAFYRSSKMIDEAAAQAAIDRIEQFSFRDYLLPSTGATRIGNPTVLVFNKAGEIVGRLNAQRDAEKNYAVAENLARLDELLAMADAGAAGESRKDSSTTTLSLAVGGAAERVTLSVNDSAAVYRVGGMKVGANEFAVREVADGASGQDAPVAGGVTLQLLVTESTLAKKTVLASGEGALRYDCTNAPANAYLLVSAYGDAQSTGYAVQGATARTLDVAATFTATPGVAGFAKESGLVMEADGGGTVVVARTGGVSGEKRVRVSVDGGSAGSGRVSLGSEELVWAEGDDAPQALAYSVEAHDGYDADETFTITLTDGEATATFALTVTDTDKPVMEVGTVEIDAFRLTALSKAYAVYNVQGTGALTLKRSGKLPSGMKLAYDKATRRVTLSGTPTKAGEYTFSATLTERRASGAATGPATTFTVVVRDPSSAESMDGFGVANPNYGKALSCVVPVIDVDSCRLAGTIKLAMSSRNRVTAAFTGWFGEKASFSGAVSDYDSETGTFSARLAKGGKACEIEVDAGGYLKMRYGDDGDEGWRMESPKVLVAAGTDLSHFAGRYTVTFPRASEGPEAVAAGTAYVTLSITAKGAAKYAGMTPDGTRIAGSVKVLTDGEVALVPMFRSAKTDTFAALLAVLPDAAAEYAEGNPAIVLAADSTVPCWSSKKGLTAEFEMNAYGGYYAKGLDLEGICEALYATSTFTADFGLDALDWTGSATPVEEVPTADVKVSKATLAAQGDGVTIRLAASTGEVTGKATLTLANGKALKANFRGAVLLGYEDCNCGDEPTVPENRPFVSGTCWFTDTVNGVRVTRSIPLDLNVKADRAD